MAEHVAIVATPNVSPRRGGIFTIADVVENQERLALGGALLFDKNWAAAIRDNVVLCFPATAETQDEKLRDGNPTEQVEIAPFGGYTGVECFLGGDDFEAAATRSLSAGEGFFLEKRVWDHLDSAGEDFVSPAVTDVRTAIALLENEVDQREHLWAPVLWVNRGDAALSKSMFRVGPDGQLSTINGTPVVSTGAVPSGKVAITGGVTVYRSSVESYVTKTLTKNREVAIAERVYAISLGEIALVATIA